LAEIQLQGISKRWGSFVGVDKLDLSIADKEFLVLLGPSGCGKTTTMRMIAGLEDASDGVIKIDNEVVNDLEPKDRDVAMVFQSYALYPNMNVYENIRFPLKVRNIDASTHHERVMRASAMVELDEFVRKPKVFLMDEPLSNLDAKLRVSTRAQIKNLTHDLAVTTIYVTHDQIEAMTLADRVVVMKNGVVQQVGSPTDIYDTPANTFVASFIGSPAMNLINGEIKNGTFESEYVSIGGLNRADGPLTLGFRAEDASLANGNTAEVTAPIYAIELLGAATMVSIRVGGALISVKADKSYRAEIGDTVSMSVPPSICHLFDAESGARITG